MSVINLLLLCLWAYQASAYAVFAHFMVTNTANYTLADWEEDIRLARDASIDAFALNMAYEDPTNDIAIPLAFQAASNVEGSFQLFFSFDYAGNGPWPKAVVAGLILQYGSHPSYFQYNSQPFVSTFEGPASAEDWSTIKEQTGCFFVPDWSSLGAKKALEAGGGGIVDGLFSWASWPWGPQDMDTYTDASYMQYLDENAQALPYMMAVSPWFYTNLPGYDKNWLWRGDHLWHDRWLEAWYLRPEFIEIISWNDYGESHYIGPLRDNAMEAFQIGEAPYNYVTGMPHDAWRDLLPFVADTYKYGIATISTETLIVWYRLQPVSACGTGGTSANTASELQLEFSPTEVLTDMVFFSALLEDTADVSVTIGGTPVEASWRNIPNEKGPQTGLFHGQAPFEGHTGEVVVTISRGGSTIAQVVGEAISMSCTDGLADYNAWTASAKASTSVNAVTPVLLDDQVCINGTGANNFAGLCEFACSYGYCPVSACTCLDMGVQKALPNATGVQGYPLEGLDASYSGLCSFDCNYGFCPDTACATISAPLSVPTVSDFDPPACISGTGSGNLAGLCSFSCAFGFCPINACTCTGTGALVVKDPTSSDVGVAVDPTDEAIYGPLCNFACQRGSCPEGACTISSSSSSSTSSTPSSSSTDNNTDNEGDLVYIDPTIWGSPTPTVTCAPPCTFILPPYTIGPTYIPWPNVTTTFYSSNTDDGQTHTVTSTIVIGDFPDSTIGWWPVTVRPGDPDSTTFTPEQSVTPPATVVVIGPYEAPIPPSVTPIITSDTSSTNPSSESSSSSITPAPIIFPSTSHGVVIQPQPSISITFPSVTPPTVHYTTGSVNGPAATPSCSGCGTYDCGIFGCPGGGCGLFGCNGGCGIFGCPGNGEDSSSSGETTGCRLSGCNSDCPLEVCGGLGCQYGACGEDGCPNGDCSVSTCEPITTTQCVEYCTVSTNAVALPTTSCTSSTCFPLIGCDVTATTATVTSTSNEACPTFTTAPSATVGQDRYDGCSPCAWAEMPLTTEAAYDSLAKRYVLPTAYRAMKIPPAIEKRGAGNAVTSEKIGGCALPTPLTLAWQGGTSFLNKALTNKLKANQKSMARWYSKTIDNCVPTVTQISDQVMDTNRKSNPEKAQQPTNDHVWERNWFNAFWTSVIKNEDDWNCERLTTVMYNRKCSVNLLQKVFNAVANNKEWDFVGMTHEVNSDYKGLIGDYPKIDAVQRNMISNNKIVATTPWAPNSEVEERGARQKLANKLKFLETLAMSCYIWTQPWVTSVLDTTNNKVYTELLAVDEYTASNASMKNTNLAVLYMDFMNNRMIDMMQAALTPANAMVINLDSSFATALAAARAAGAPGVQEYEALNAAYQSLLSQFNLKENPGHVCQSSITLSWKKLDSAKRDLGDDICEIPTTTTTTSSSSTTSTTTAPSPNPTAQVVIALEEDPSSVEPFSWEFFDFGIGASWTACDGIGRVEAPSKEDSDGYPYPDGDRTLDFKIDGMSDCTYSGTSEKPGTFTCPDLSESVQCEAWGETNPSYCDGLDVISITPMVVCRW
ncbi:hypothetical protein AnigIFM63309_009465 [Aspergillus niger]|nr:hypothetical protein AnigIFM63309_009465 [Aspergillus niger]